jgi:AcrR family transcriptional regulator
MGRTGDTRGRIVAVARQLFAEKGFDGATTAAIAAAAGIAGGTIYRHFSDKKELFIACVTPALSESVTQGLESIQTAADARTALRALVELRLRLLRENLDSFNILFTEAFHHPELADLFVERFVFDRPRRVAPALARLVEAGELQRPPNPMILGPGILSAMWGVLNVQKYMAARWPDRAPVITDQQLIDDLTELLLYGLAGRPPEP